MENEKHKIINGPIRKSKVYKLINTKLAIKKIILNFFLFCVVGAMKLTSILGF